MTPAPHVKPCQTQAQALAGLMFIVGDVRELWPFLVALFVPLLQFPYAENVATQSQALAASQHAAARARRIAKLKALFIEPEEAPGNPIAMHAL